MIEAVVQGLERGLDVGKIHHPAALRIDLAADMELDAERMPMQTRALVARRDVRQPVRGFKGEDFENVHGLALRIAGPR